MKFTPFQAILLSIFGIAIVGGLVVIATVKNSNQKDIVPITIWGTIPNAGFSSAISNLIQGSSGLKITYVEKRSETFDHDLIEAIASGIGPDAILLPQDLIMRYRDKILPISYNTIPLPTFKNTFVEESELYLDSNGILAVPFSIDPLVMYWNRDMLSNAGVSLPPSTWDEFILLAQKITKKDKNLNIIKSAVSLGEYRNISNAQELVSAFFLQAKNPITAFDSGRLVSTLSPASLSTIGAINFYSDFANPVKPDYSWNRSLPNSIDMFASGDLAFYFGFASDADRIKNKNPNLNFDVTYFPQPKGAQNLITFGKMQGLAVLRTSSNGPASIKNVLYITDSAPLELYSKATGLPPVRRSMLVANPSDPYQAIFYNSAIRARAWLNPNPANSSAIFQRMIESITSGEREVGEAIEVAGKELSASAQ